MKSIHLLGAVAIACAFSSAKADDLVITANGLQAYYSGTLQHVETQGLSGEVVMTADFPGSFSEDGDPGPTQTGAWHVVVIQPDGSRFDTVMDCDATTAYTTSGGRVSMNCATPMSSRSRKR
jgi:hypothetical protein